MKNFVLTVQINSVDIITTKKKKGEDWIAEIMGYRTSSMEDAIEEKT